MSLRNIRVLGDDILRKKARKVEVIDDRIIELLDDMLETMRSRDGVGLAAPQVGVLRRVVIVDVGDGLYEFIKKVYCSLFCILSFSFEKIIKNFQIFQFFLLTDKKSGFTIKI